MSLVMAKYLSKADDTPLRFNTETGWQGVSTGLGLVVRGYLVLIAAGIVGPVLVWLALDGGGLGQQLNNARQDRDTLMLMGALVLGLGPIACYALVLCGQWRCLMYAPQAEHSKELMYICLNCVILGSILKVTGLFLGGSEVYAALQQGTAGLDRLNLTSLGVLLLLGSATLAFLGSLVFSLFLRSVAGCFQDRARVRSVELNLLFVGLLLGGSIGTLFLVQPLAPKAVLLSWLGAGWLLCFAWHFGLVGSIRRGLKEGLQRRAAEKAPVVANAGSLATNTLSGLYRLVRET
ncbi:MAG: hypothetical protein L0Z62_45230 [Gemmataceae bacterium]|nr:hypothetical protein [Gemmataceae bacterium]